MRFLRKLGLAAAALVGLSLAGPIADAAVTANSNITPQTPNRGIVQFLQGTDAANTDKTLYTAGANGSICKGMTATTNDGSTAHLITVQLKNGSVDYGGTAVNVPVSSGFASGAPPVNMMSSTNWPGLPLDSDNNPFIYLISGDTLQAQYASTLTSAKVANVIVVCSDF